MSGTSDDLAIFCRSQARKWAQIADKLRSMRDDPALASNDRYEAAVRLEDATEIEREYIEVADSAHKVMSHILGLFPQATPH